MTKPDQTQITANIRLRHLLMLITSKCHCHLYSTTICNATNSYGIVIGYTASFLRLGNKKICLPSIYCAHKKTLHQAAFFMLI